MKRICLWVCAAVLTVFSVANALAPDGDTGEAMLYVLTLGALCYAIWFGRAEAFFQQRKHWLLRFLLRGTLLFFAGMIAFLALMGNTDTATGTERVVIALGAPLNGAQPCRILLERLNAAEAFLRRHPALPAVLSGGRMPGEEIAEAEAMYACLTAAGIDGSRLWVEDQSQSTSQNMLESRALLSRRGLNGDDPVAILTNSFHCYRARRYAERAGFRNINILPCHTGWADCPTWYLREVVATVAFWLTGG